MDKSKSKKYVNFAGLSMFGVESIQNRLIKCDNNTNDDIFERFISQSKSYEIQLFIDY